MALLHCKTDPGRPLQQKASASIGSSVRMARLRSTRMAEYALAIQRSKLNIVKREKWTEARRTSRGRGSRGIGGACAAPEFVEGGSLPDRAHAYLNRDISRATDSGFNWGCIQPAFPG